MTWIRKLSLSSFVILTTLMVLTVSAQLGFAADTYTGPTPLRPEQLKVMTYNLRNFSYLYRLPKKDLGQIDPKINPIKPEYEIKMEGQILRNEQPDILAIQEVMDQPGFKGSGKSYLETFNEEELNGAYQIFLTPGNDPRGINVALLVKKNLPFTNYNYITNKNLTWNDIANKGKIIPMFSRDLPILEMRVKADDSIPALIAIGSHYKSQRDRDNDPKSSIYRHAQYEATRDIINNLKSKYGPSVNILLMADFNEELTGHAEAPIEEVTEACFDLTTNTVPVADRITEVSFGPGGVLYRSMLDDVKISGLLTKRVLAATIIRYRGKNGEILPYPNRWNESRQFPSDHFPVETIIDITGLLHK